MSKVSDKEIKANLHYDGFSGQFFWLPKAAKKTSKAKRIGCGLVLAGSRKKTGYVIIIIKGRSYLAHRLAWKYITGKWPDYEIDHINRIKYDNRFSNLREATTNQNKRNIGVRINGTSKYKGVQKNWRWSKLKKQWRASIKIDGRAIYLGYFISEEEAAIAYNNAAKRFYGEYAYLNKIGGS